MPPLGFGLQFVDLTDEQFEKLRSLFDKLQPPQNPASAILSY